MQRRKPHSKSRKGCQNCKTRHIKCDEQGPPCANCVARNTTSSCTYTSTRPQRPSQLQASRSLSPNPEVASEAVSTGSSLAFVGDHVALSPLPPLNGANRLLELELMNRWSTRTWTCLYVIPPCQAYLQESLPRAALQNNYLMNAIFSLAAADLACSASNDTTLAQEKAKYFCAALHYGNEAAREFRSHVHGVTPHNIELLMYFSTVIALLNFVTPVEGTTALGRVGKYFDMVGGMFGIAATHTQWLLDSSAPARAAAVGYGPDAMLMKRIDHETMAALDILSSVSRRVGEGEADGAQYKLAVAQTRYSFAEDAVGRMKGYFSTIPAVGMELANGARHMDPMALFVFMYFGVLLDRSSRDPMMWVLGSVGRELVDETSVMVLASSIAGIPGVREGIEWARNEVELPTLGRSSTLLLEM